MIERERVNRHVMQALKRSRIVALVGPRQSGKTTLARQLVPRGPRYFDLEEPASLARLDEPMTALEPLRGLVAIDEVQRRPDLFPVLRVLADRRPAPARFLLLGSAAPGLLRQASESLAGRIETIELSGFQMDEVGDGRLAALWWRGGFPRSFLARSGRDSRAWRRHFIATYLERDLPQLGIAIPPAALLRFWRMVAHSHGSAWSGADIARSLGVSEPTVRRYLDLLTGLFLVRQLQPWHANLAKRQVKSPKVYVRDSGLLHELLGVASPDDLLAHPECGASWEGFAIEQVLGTVAPDEAYFWATHQGAELDLLLVVDGRRYGVEVKRNDAPRMTPSIRVALDDLELHHLTVLYPGRQAYDLDARVSVRPLADLASAGRSLVVPLRRRPGRR